VRLYRHRAELPRGTVTFLFADVERPASLLSELDRHRR